MRNLILLIPFIGIQILCFAKDDPKSSKLIKPGGSSNAKAAECEGATAKLVMDYNDVRCLLEPAGLLWFDRAGQGQAYYQVPKGELGVKSASSIFAGSLWMGGKDATGNIKLAAERFRENGTHDFSTGPLSTSAGPNPVETGDGNYDISNPVGNGAIKGYGAAIISADECLKWDKFFTVEKSDVISFKVWYDCQQTGADPIVCATVPNPTPNALNSIVNWPGNGDAALFQDFYLAPYFNNPLKGNAEYNPEDGDYPWFDDILGRDDIKCKADRRISLFGDISNWFIFNDKGSEHTSTNAEPIGLEIRGQAFCFATSDEINRMTFYNYEIINRGTQILNRTYFSQFADIDLGLASDDLVGCDVSRGLGFMYNSTNNDAGQPPNPGYGISPPVIGFDFFEGPYQDADQLDNPGPIVFPDGTATTVTVASALAGKGIVYGGIGVGYGDGIPDNERYGMRNFKYFSIGTTNAQNGDPISASDYYNLMSGFWKNGTDVTYGNQGLDASGVKTDFTFPGTSDPLGWATGGTVQAPWDMTVPNDYRMLQTAGPFTLKPGAVNNLTVGVVYGRAGGGPLQSIEAMKVADTKAQALFDNCFRLVEPPEAPVLNIQELDKEVILTISNPNVAAYNYKERYKFLDFNIVSNTGDKFYRFQGYQIFQLADARAAVGDIGDVDKVRLVAQCDIKDGISGQIVNFERDEALGYDVPVSKVISENLGIRHSFQVKNDAFAQGLNKSLVNHKTYYFVAVAYGYNNFKEYDPTDPLKLDGQKTPYIISRQGQFGGKIESVAAIPHIVRPEAGGTIQNVQYGSTPEITRLDGTGNANRATELTSASVSEILRNGKADKLTYVAGKGPIDVKVVDPLNIAKGYFELKLRGTNDLPVPNNGVNNFSDKQRWSIIRYASEGGAILDSVVSDSTLVVKNEQLIPEWGLSVSITNDRYFGYDDLPQVKTIEELQIPTPISSSISFADSSKKWLATIPDGDGTTPQNYLANGGLKVLAVPASCNTYGQVDNECAYFFDKPRDPESKFTKGQGLVPFWLSNVGAPGLPVQAPPSTFDAAGLSSPTNIVAVRDAMTKSVASSNPSLPGTLNDVDLVITSDKSKWTRCPVIELGWDNNAINTDVTLANRISYRGLLRNQRSVGKDGLPDGTGNGYGWFPGYAIDVNTGVRLFMAFGENSNFNSGKDMIWNPTSDVFQGAGQHAVYISGASANVAYNNSGGTIVKNIPLYSDNSNYFSSMITTNTLMTSTQIKNFYGSMQWLLYPYLSNGQSYLSTDVTIKARVNKRFRNYVATGRNNGLPMYSWNTENMVATKDDASTLADALDLINVVPNPYYAYSQYERSRIDNRVKIVNLPVKCKIQIYNVSGKLIRAFNKDSEITSQDWDLANSSGVPIASGVYLIHVDVPGAGEKIVKFFCGMRQIDLQNI